MRVLVTAGGTVEPIDPVRCISNHSSGRTGVAIARALSARGHRVTLVGPATLPTIPGVHRYPVLTAREMLAKLKELLPAHNALVMAAAVADYRPKTAARTKLKKNAARIRLELVRNPDILQTLARRKKPRQIFVGFALEAPGGGNRRSKSIELACEKMRRKKLDMIVANGPENLGGDKCTMDVIAKSGQIRSFAGTKRAFGNFLAKLLEALDPA